MKTKEEVQDMRNGIREDLLRELKEEIAQKIADLHELLDLEEDDI